MSSCTTTVPNSVRISAPVGQTSRQAASVQCLQTLLAISQRRSPSAAGCSMKATCRQVDALRSAVLSYDMPVSSSPSSGTEFHSLQATSQALQPMHTEVSVKNPMRGGWASQPTSAAGSLAAVVSSGNSGNSGLRPGFFGDPGAVLIAVDQRAQRPAAGPPSRLDVHG